MSMICFHISLRETGKAMRILSVKVTPTIICVPSTTAMDSMTTAVPGLPICGIQRQDLVKTSEFTNEWRIRFRSLLCWMRLLMKETSSTAGGISAERKCSSVSGRLLYAGHIRTRRDIYESGQCAVVVPMAGNCAERSWKRFDFLHRIMCETPGIGLAPAVRSGMISVRSRRMRYWHRKQATSCTIIAL